MGSVQVTSNWTFIHLGHHVLSHDWCGFRSALHLRLSVPSVSAADVWLEISVWVNAELITAELVFTHHASNCQAMGPPLCFARTDSSPLTSFIGVRTFFFFLLCHLWLEHRTINWQTWTLAAETRQLSFIVWKTTTPPPHPQPSDESSHEDQPTVFE